MMALAAFGLRLPVTAFIFNLRASFPYYCRANMVRPDRVHPCWSLTSTPRRAMAATSWAMRNRIAGSMLLVFSPARASPLILRSTLFHLGFGMSSDAKGALGVAVSSGLVREPGIMVRGFDGRVVQTRDSCTPSYNNHTLRLKNAPFPNFCLFWKSVQCGCHNDGQKLTFPALG